MISIYNDLNEKIAEIFSLMEQGHKFENLSHSISFLKNQANGTYDKNIISDIEYREIMTKIKIIERIYQSNLLNISEASTTY